MRFTQLGSSFATHVGSVADLDPLPRADPPDSVEVISGDITFIAWPELDALGFMVGGIGDGSGPTYELDATVTNLDVALSITPLEAGGTSVDWGDGTPVTTATGGSASHTYAADGTYTITAGGTTTTDVTVAAPVIPEEPGV